MAAQAKTGVDWLERAAIGASAVCLIHCLALPLVIAALPALTAVLSIPESFHIWVFAAALPMASVALLQGRAKHRDQAPLCIGFVGLTLMAIGALHAGAAIETPVTVFGSLALATAHVINWRLRHTCRC